VTVSDDSATSGVRWAVAVLEALATAIAERAEAT
jgi:hypothetical protein